MRCLEKHILLAMIWVQPSSLCPDHGPSAHNSLADMRSRAAPRQGRHAP